MRQPPSLTNVFQFYFLNELPGISHLFFTVINEILNDSRGSSRRKLGPKSDFSLKSARLKRSLHKN